MKKNLNQTTATNTARFFEPVLKILKIFSIKNNKDRAMIDQYFPIVDPIVTPISNRVIIQLKNPLKQSAKGKLFLTVKDETAQLWNEQVARVIAIGPSAFQFQRDGKVWPEGNCFKVGDFVLVPTHRADRWDIEDKSGGANKEAHFVMMRDFEIMALIHGNPLDVKNKSIGGIN